LKELLDRYAGCSANLPEFKNVEATLARLILADKRLRLAELLGDLRLGEARFSPDPLQKL